MAGHHLKVVLERGGGFAGRTIRRGLDTAELPSADANRLFDLVNDLPPTVAVGQANPAPARASGPDRFTYRLVVEEDGHPRQAMTFPEPVPPDLRPLVDLLSRAPLLRAGS
jgi:hypothetical protein